MSPTVAASAAAAAAPSPKKGPKNKAGMAPAPSANNNNNNDNDNKESTGVMDYLQSSLPRTSLLELYNDPDRGQFVCQAVLQRLPQTSQQIVVRLMCTGDGRFALSMVKLWLSSPTSSSSSSSSALLKRHKAMTRQLEELYQWAIIVRNPCVPSNDETDTNDNTTIDMVQLEEGFLRGYRDSLHSLDVSPWNPLTPDIMQTLEDEANRQARETAAAKGMTKPPPYQKLPRLSLEDLERHTQAQWDLVLHYLVGTKDKPSPPPGVVSFLVETNLMQIDPEYRGANPELEAPLVITNLGYDFMLQDNAQQVWHFVVQYLNKMVKAASDAHGGDDAKAKDIQREALLFLISLSFCRLGDCYLGSSLSKNGRIIARDLSSFGLLYWKKLGRVTIFYPTRVALQLVGATDGASTTSGGSGGGGGMWSWSSKALDSALAHPRPHDSSHLAIIVQTTFTVCAYTTSELHESMLGLFCDLQTIRRLPNVIMMTISRDSIKGAFALGIKAQQILRFLEKHAHPKLREGTTSPVPQNIIDQIFLWDRERHRVIWDEVYVHTATMEGEFEAIVKGAKDRGALAWANRNRQTIMIKYRLADRMQRFIQVWKAKKASGV